MKYYTEPPGLIGDIALRLDTSKVLTGRDECLVCDKGMPSARFIQ